jgi:Ca2+-binding RTX toxin-like protein
VTGTAGADTLTGTSGDDVIDGGAGADVMRGGAGNDTYIVDNTRDVVIEGVGAGRDTVRASVGYALPANVEQLVVAADAGAVSATGNSLDNLIIGNDAANIIDGRGGRDTLSGAGGDDVYQLSGDPAAVTIVEAAAGGVDTVKIAKSRKGTTYTLPDEVENLE